MTDEETKRKMDNFAETILEAVEQAEEDGMEPDLAKSLLSEFARAAVMGDADPDKEVYSWLKKYLKREIP